MMHRVYAHIGISDAHIKEQPPLNEDEECLTRCGFLIHYYSCARND